MPTSPRRPRSDVFWTLHLAEGLDYCYFQGELPQIFTLQLYPLASWELLHVSDASQEAWYAEVA